MRSIRMRGGAGGSAQKPEIARKRRSGLVAGRRLRRWLAVAAVAILAWLGGLLAALWWRGPAAGLGDGKELAAIVDLPLPEIPPDLHPQYRDLLEESAGVAAELVASFPDDVRAVEALARLHNLAHHEAAEVACYQRCLELDPACVPACERLAKRAMEQGDFARAEALLGEALARNPSHAEFARMLADALVGQGKQAEALQVLEGYAAGRPSPPAVLLLLGQLYLQQKQEEKAKAQFEKVLALDPNSAPAHLGLATACRRLGNTAGAQRHQAKFAELKAQEEQAARQGKKRLSDAYVVPPCAALIMTIAGNVYLAHGQLDLAEKRLLRAAELDPAGVACREALATFYAEAGRLEDAVRVVETLRELEPHNLAHRKTLGILQVRMNQLDAAETTFRETCAAAPTSALGYAGLAELYLRAGKRLPEARDLAATAVRLEPTAWHYFILGAICEKQGDQAAARAALQQAAALEPNNPRYTASYESLGQRP